MSAQVHFTPEHSKVTIGIVTFNSAAFLAGCLDSVVQNLADAVPSVIIVDNSSADNTVKTVSELRKRLPCPITLIPERSNHGYAWGVNRICELVRTDWVCLINPDARLLTPAYVPVRDLAARVPTCGVIGGVVVDPEGKPQESGGVFPTPLMEIWDWCGLRHVFPRRNWSTTLKLDLPATSPPRKVDYPTGAFWMFRREVFKRVGPFDEQFFLYFEETDFCRRAKKIGWPAYIMPSIRVEHVRGASITEFESSGPDALSIYFESMIRYLEKHFPPPRVSAALRTIGFFLQTRMWLRKDSKSERILEAFETGLRKVEEVKGTQPAAP
jgi:hypothetical protein